MRGLHQSPPSSSPPPLIPGTPNSQSQSSSASTSYTSLPPPLSTFQTSIAHLQAQNAELYSSMDSFRTQMQSQFDSFQQNMLDAVLRIQPTPSVTHSSPISQLTTSPLSFGSRQPISTTWSGLGLSNPPSSPIHSTFIPVSTQSPASIAQTRPPLQNTTAIYSTLTSIPTSFSPLQDHTFPQFQTHPYTFSSHPASHMSYKKIFHAITITKKEIHFIVLYVKKLLGVVRTREMVINLFLLLKVHTTQSMHVFIILCYGHFICFQI